MKRERMLGAVMTMLMLSPLWASSANDELTRVLHEFLTGASTDSVAAHDRFWAEDLIYTSSAGERFGKSKIMDDLSQVAVSPIEVPTSVYSAEEIRIQQYGNIAIVAFRLVSTSSGESGDKAAPMEVQHYFNTGTFLKRDDVWQAVAWQATKIPPSD